ncbi:MAG TPA: MraY family glycosyltransferase [Candidatus Paceibacterota bacterium]|nr:MraY family glycosyltransferase [Verrucomicrobiota bacterium]HSA11266.1 MraY family glycosyltransferase [Candidatus Paceibacterota bacterium]
MNYWGIATCGLLGLAIVLVVIPLILRAAHTRNLFRRRYDLHHTHQKPIPRVGGLALAAALIGVTTVVVVFWPEHKGHADWLTVLATSLAMFGIGFWDDLKPLGARRKLAGQILIALSVCALGIGITHLKIPFTERVIPLGGWGVFITVAWLVGMTNLINLIDGVDGLAGGICLMLMGLLAYVAHASGGFDLMAAGMAGALVGFLYFNFPPARIYLGDGGAYLLGFQIGLFAILSSHKGTVFAALAAPLFVLALPIVDTALAIMRRGLRGLPIFRPDRKHLHHHLLGMGMSRRRVVLSLYGISLIFLVMGFTAYWSRGNLVPVLLGAGVLILLLLAGKLRFSRNWFAVGHVVGTSLEMRQEIQYALTLMRWLAMEGSRRNSVEDLWADLVFAVQRLGYSSVRLTLADGQRVWQQADDCPSTLAVVHKLQGGRLGILELKAPYCDVRPDPSKRQQECGRACCPCVADRKVFEIVTDLLAEGWVRGIGHPKEADHAPLRFDTKLAAPINRTQSEASSLSAPVTLPGIARKHPPSHRETI